MENRMIFMLLAAVTLAGCGGSTATTPTVTPIPVVNPTPDPVVTPPVVDAPSSTPSGQDAATARLAQAALLAAHTPVAFTDVTVVPTTGSASYNGYLSGNLGNLNDTVTNAISGQLSLDVDFTTSGMNVSGQADQFYDGNDIAMTGALSVSGGQFDRAGNPDADVTLRITTNGTLTDVQGRQLVVGAQLEGDFLGASYNGVGGDMLGRVTVNGAAQNLDGVFIAER